MSKCKIVTRLFVQLKRIVQWDFCELFLWPVRGWQRVKIGLGSLGGPTWPMSRALFFFLYLGEAVEKILASTLISRRMTLFPPSHALTTAISRLVSIKSTFNYTPNDGAMSCPECPDGHSWPRIAMHGPCRRGSVIRPSNRSIAKQCGSSEHGRPDRDRGGIRKLRNPSSAAAPRRVGTGE